MADVSFVELFVDRGGHRLTLLPGARHYVQVDEPPRVAATIIEAAPEA